MIDHNWEYATLPARDVIAAFATLNDGHIANDAVATEVESLI